MNPANSIISSNSLYLESLGLRPDNLLPENLVDLSANSDLSSTSTSTSNIPLYRFPWVVLNEISVRDMVPWGMTCKANYRVMQQLKKFAVAMEKTEEAVCAASKSDNIRELRSTTVGLLRFYAGFDLVGRMLAIERRLKLSNPGMPTPISDLSGDGPLAHAIRNCSYAAIRCFLHGRTQFSVTRDATGNQPNVFHAFTEMGDDNPSLVILLAKNIPPSAWDKMQLMQDPNGKTPVSYARFHRRLRMVKAFSVMNSSKGEIIRHNAIVERAFVRRFSHVAKLGVPLCLGVAKTEQVTKSPSPNESPNASCLVCHRIATANDHSASLFSIPLSSAPLQARHLEREIVAGPPLETSSVSTQTRQPETVAAPLPKAPPTPEELKRLENLQLLAELPFYGNWNF